MNNVILGKNKKKLNWKEKIAVKVLKKTYVKIFNTTRIYIMK